MSPLGTHDVAIGEHLFYGQRVCPNPVCRGHLFVVLNGGQLIAAYPPVRLDFDPENLPSNVLRTFEEAISCHASGLYIAAAIMVRRTLEEVYAERQAQGKDLKQRIADLRGDAHRLPCGIGAQEQGEHHRGLQVAPKAVFLAHAR